MEACVLYCSRASSDISIGDQVVLSGDFARGFCGEAAAGGEANDIRQITSLIIERDHFSYQ